jgi:hypothetical protein
MKLQISNRFPIKFFRWSLILILLVLLIACKSNQGGSETPSISETPLPTSGSPEPESRVESILTSIDPDEPDTLYAPEELIAIGHDVVPELIEYLNSPDLVTRWAVVYVLTRIAQPEDIPGLVQGLEDPNLSNRAGIAATLLWLGDDRGLPILEEALLSDELMVFSHPPESVSDYARKVLQELHPESLSEEQAYSTHVLAAPVKSPSIDVSVSKSDCKVEIVVNLQFSGAGASEALASTWKQGIMDMWDGKQSTYCCETALTVNTKVGGATAPDYAQVTVIQVPPGGYHQSENSLGGTVANGTSNDVWGTWASNDNGKVAAHETGHAMGIDDEYTPDADGYAVPSGEAVGEADGAGIPGIMAQTWEDAENQAPEAKPRHIDSILKFYGIECVCCGLVEWDASGAGFSFVGKISTCDGVNWSGELTENLQISEVSAEAAADFNFVIENNANAGETDFVAEGNWSTSQDVIPFQDNINFKISLIENGSKALLDMSSTGGVLYLQGQTVPVPQAMPATTGELSLPVLPNPSCKSE